jgi:hypothetical protein
MNITMNMVITGILLGWVIGAITWLITHKRRSPLEVFLSKHKKQVREDYFPAYRDGMWVDKLGDE